MMSLLGGGIGVLKIRAILKSYALNPNAFHDAHSIYFRILSDHGFIGLGLYLTLAITTRGAELQIGAAQVVGPVVT